MENEHTQNATGGLIGGQGGFWTIVDGVFSRNIVHGDSASGALISLAGANIFISDNKFANNNATGVYIDNGSRFVEISRNNFSGSGIDTGASVHNPIAIVTRDANNSEAMECITISDNKFGYGGASHDGTDTYKIHVNFGQGYCSEDGVTRCEDDGDCTGTCDFDEDIGECGITLARNQVYNDTASSSFLAFNRTAETADPQQLASVGRIFLKDNILNQGVLAMMSAATFGDPIAGSYPKCSGNIIGGVDKHGGRLGECIPLEGGSRVVYGGATNAAPGVGNDRCMRIDTAAAPLTCNSDSAVNNNGYLMLNFADNGDGYVESIKCMFDQATGADSGDVATITITWWKDGSAPVKSTNSITMDLFASSQGDISTVDIQEFPPASISPPDGIMIGHNVTDTNTSITDLESTCSFFVP